MVTLATEHRSSATGMLKRLVSPKSVLHSQELGIRTMVGHVLSAAIASTLPNLTDVTALSLFFLVQSFSQTFATDGWLYSTAPWSLGLNLSTLLRLPLHLDMASHLEGEMVSYIRI